MLSVRKTRFALVFLKYWFDLAYAKDPAGSMQNSSNSTEEQQFCWNPEHLGLDPNEAKILPGDYEVWVMKAQEPEQRGESPEPGQCAVAHAGLALLSPSAALAASPEHPVAEARECFGTAQSHQHVQQGTGNCSAAWLSNQRLLSTLDSPGSWMRWKEDLLLFALKC